MDKKPKPKRPPVRSHMDPYRKREDIPRNAPEEDGLTLIEGRNAVMEALRAGHPIDKVYLAKSEGENPLGYIAAAARDAGAVVVDADRRKLDQMSQTHAHQGVIAVAAAIEYADVQDLLDRAAQRGQTPLLVLCDGIEDPHNLGAIIRTAEAAGAHGIIIPKRRSAGVTAVVEKTSAGAVEHLPIARVPNLTAAIQDLKKQGVWICGTDAKGERDLWNSDLTGPLAIVIGSEGSGMSRLVREACDFCVSIPMQGMVNSLNASASAAVVIYEAIRQRSAGSLPEQ